ncbi:hypothetical protein J437_LFUL010207, partial [Ladona fulva]
MEGHHIALLSHLKEDELKEFLHSCINEICGRKGPNYADFRQHDEFSMDNFSSLVIGAKKLCTEMHSLDMDFEKVKEFIPALEYCQYEVLRDCLEVRKDELMTHAAVEKVSKSDNVLMDYDWKLKWIVGSSSFSDIQEPLLNLDLHMRCGNEKKTLNLELDKSELKLMIEALEKAQQTMLN